MIAVVVPTIREDCFKRFMNGWRDLFSRHDVDLIKVQDGDFPTLTHYGRKKKRHDAVTVRSVEEVMGKDADLIFNKNDGVRNLGFAYIAKNLESEYIITLDDDTLPNGDTIQDHIDALNKRVSVSWLSTASEYMRGFPYNVREESEVVLSHGVWEGVKDWDAPTQLINGNKNVEFYKGPIPKGVHYPMCGMNIAFKRKLLPYMYYAPMGHRVGLDRFADIWLGIESKKVIDRKGWAVVSGYAKVNHNRASNVWTNLVKESKGLGMNEDYGKDPYFKLYKECRTRWQKLLQ